MNKVSKKKIQSNLEATGFAGEERELSFVLTKK